MNKALQAATRETEAALIEAGAVLNRKNRGILAQAVELLQTALRDAGLIDANEPDASEPPAKQPPAKPQQPQTQQPKTANTKPTKQRENAALIEAGGFSVADLALLLEQALLTSMGFSTKTDMPYDRRPMINDVYDDTFVYRDGYNGPFYRVGFTVDETGNVSLDVPTLVVRKVQYVEPGNGLQMSESGESEFAIETDTVELIERAVKPDGSTRIKLISPGIGSSGYYARDVLERDGPRAFPKGTQMLWDHLTEREMQDKPEGSLHNLAAVLTSDAAFDPNGPRGAGLYADAKVFEPFRDRLNEIAPHIGVSIHASGRAKMGEIDGKKMPIVTAIGESKLNTADFVTRAGAGGEIVELFEAAKRQTASTQTHNERVDEMTPEEIATLVERAVANAVGPLRQQIDAQRDAADLIEAERAVARYLATIEGLPNVARERLAPEIARGFTRTESGSIDAGKLIEAARQRVSQEMSYLRGAGAYNVPGFGDSASLNESASTNAEQFETEFAADMQSFFGAIGLNEAAAKTATIGRK